MGAYLRVGFIQGGLIKLSDKCCKKSSLSKLLSKSSSSSGVGAYSRGAYKQFDVLAWRLIQGKGFFEGGGPI